MYAQLDRATGHRSVSVAVVTCNTRNLLRACLDSVLAQAPAEVVVVDNASTDGTADMVRCEYPQVALHANIVNCGYGSAANLAVRKCRGEYVLLLNGDAMVTPGAIGALSAYMDQHPEAAVVGPLLRHPNGSLQRSYFPFPGTLNWFLENEPVVWLLRCLPFVRTQFLCFTTPTADRVVPWVLGAALLLRRAPFEAVGGFDESYFMYFEEVDLCLRLRAGPFQIHFTPSATVLHVNGASTSQCRKQMLTAHFRSSQRFYRRHYSKRRAWFWISLMKLKIAVLLVRDVVRFHVGSDETTRAMLAQHVVAWKAILRGLPEYAIADPMPRASRSLAPDPE